MSAGIKQTKQKKRIRGSLLLLLLFDSQLTISSSDSDSDSDFDPNEFTQRKTTKRKADEQTPGSQPTGQLSTITRNFVSSLKPEFQQYSNTLQQGVISYCQVWSRRRRFAYQLVRVILENKLTNDFSDFDNRNYYSQILLFGHSNQRAGNQILIDRAIELMRQKGFEPPEWPQIDGSDLSTDTAIELASSFERDTKNMLWSNFIKWQAICIEAILKLNKDSYQFNSDDFKLNSPVNIQLASMFVRKKINQWKFKHECDSKIFTYCDKIQAIINYFKSIIPFDYQSQWSYKQLLTKKLLKELKTGQLMSMTIEMIDYTRSLLVEPDKFVVQICPKVRNSIDKIRFTHKSFRALFPKLLPEFEFDLFDLFDIKGFHASNRHFSGSFWTNGIQLCVLFDRSAMISNQYKYYQQNKHQVIMPHERKIIVRSTILCLRTQTSEIDNDIK
jgi:hypothetical protein